MSIPLFDYIKSLLPRLKKDDILEDVRVTKGELDNLKKTYDMTVKEFTDFKWKAEVSQSLIKTFYRNYKSSVGKANDIVADIAKALPNLQDNTHFVETQLEQLLGDDVLNAGLTAKKAVLIRACEHLSFLSRYGLDFLDYLLCAESAVKGQTMNMMMSNATVERVEKEILTFSQLLTYYSKPKDKFKSGLDDIPDVVLDDNNAATVASVFSHGVLDPYGSVLQQGFIGSPVYHIRLIFAEWQADRYKVCKDKRQMLELRIMQLKLLQEDLNDPSLERQIEYLQSRIDKLDRKLADMET